MWARAAANGGLFTKGNVSPAGPIRTTSSLGCKWRATGTPKVKVGEGPRPEAIEMNGSAGPARAERAKLAERNRLRWADPATAAARGLLSGRPGRPNAGPNYQPPGRASGPRTMPTGPLRWRASDAAREAPEARAKFSALLRARWQDPQWRNRWLTGIARAASDPSNSGVDQTAVAADHLEVAAPQER